MVIEFAREPLGGARNRTGRSTGLPRRIEHGDVVVGLLLIGRVKTAVTQGGLGCNVGSLILVLGRAERIKIGDKTFELCRVVCK